MTLSDEICRSVSVPDALELLGLDLPARIPGLIRCPVHEDDTPSLNVDEDKWYCHGCGTGGRVIDLVMFVGGVSFGQACAFLGGSVDELGPVPERKEQAPRELPDLTVRYDRVAVADSGHQVDEYQAWCAQKWPQWPDMADRILAEQWARLGDHNLWIPHTSADGIVRGIKLRVMSRPQTGKKNAIKGSAFSTRLYRVVDRPWAPLAYLVEGETDTWTMQVHAGDRNIAVYGMPSGVGTWKRWFAEELNDRHGMVVVILDADEPGEKGWGRVSGTLDYPVRVMLPRDFNDVTEASAAGWSPPW